MKEELRRIAWDETSRLRPGDLFELARRYCELRFRPGEVYADFMEAGQAKEEAVRERLYEMLRDQLQTYLRQARGGEPLKIRIQVRRHSISIAGVGERPTGPDPKTHSGTLGRRP